ncbi:PA14 domain-containing protein [Methylomonas sp. AM2-LC]|uniref:PA14 domain-containing protein n=1 Tax=Methylomonas sp. AM2-LC TaxID=3153301 RepID=UPI0032639866
MFLNSAKFECKHILKVLTFFTFSSFNYAYADTFSSTIALPTIAGTGLNGSYYAFNTWPGSLANTQNLINAAGAPTATFTATSVCFPSCNTSIGDGSTLAQYLGANASNISLNNITNLSEHAVVLNGYIAITAPGSYQFSILSDDGSQLQIGGKTIFNADGDHGFSGGTATVQFSNSGLYKFDVLAFEDAGVTGLTVLENGNALTANQLFTSAVPEAEEWTMLMLGLCMMGWVTRSKQSVQSITVS